MVADCAASGVPRVWLHRGLGPGSSSPAAVQLCHEHGITVIPGGCPNMFGATGDPGHKCMRAVLRVTGKLPRTVWVATDTLGAGEGAAVREGSKR